MTTPNENRRQIRKATPADAGALAQCMQQAYSIYQARLGGGRLPPMDADYAAEIENCPSWVIEADGKIMGGLIMLFDDSRAVVANVAIHPQYQGQGIGGELMRFAESAARERGHAELRLTTHVLLEENLALYRHLGFAETGRDDTRVTMRKKL